MKANDNKFDNRVAGRVCLPLPTLDLTARLEMDVYARFMRHLRQVANSRDEIKILSAIQFISDMLDMDDVVVTAMLVDMGLRAPRMAYPGNYLEAADHSLMREDWEEGAASESLKDLQAHWSLIGEDRFAGFKRFYPHIAEDLFTRL